MQLRIVAHQSSFKVGDLFGNTEKIIKLYRESECDLVVFPELCLTGYNCKDLFLDRSFISEINRCILKIVNIVGDKALLIGVPQLIDNQLFNSAILLKNSRIEHVYHKHYLPNYGVFDEKRYFEPGNKLSSIFELNGFKIRLLICEDLWHPEAKLSMADILCEVTIVMNASPYAINKARQRIKLLKDFSIKYKQKYVIYVNSVGAHDHLLFDGSSTIVADNKVLISPTQWEERIISTVSGLNLDVSCNGVLYQETEQSDIFNLNDTSASEIYNGIILSLREYSDYACCKKFVIGLSGGVDSALVAVMAVDAFGSENVLCVAMPSQYSSQSSIDDAKALVEKLKCDLEIISIVDIKSVFDSILQPLLGILADDDLTNENLQPRIRATILMAIANKQNRLLLSTSNKSESAVGYSTLYGDMTGAYAPIVDLYKTQVYSICRWKNKRSNIIPENILIKEPSAELKPCQKDSDSLPDYVSLDKILYNLIELRCDPEGFDPQLIHHIKNLLYKGEFKRFQAPPGPKINNITLGSDRRYPICLKV
jgi:NAD+ synthase (glutamine-hydrolysing)